MVNPPARKRHVVSRDRNGCVTCRARRLKCDEGKPSCQNCTRFKIQCGGYKNRLVFKDQTDRLRKKHGSGSHSRNAKQQSPPAPNGVTAPADMTQVHHSTHWQSVYVAAESLTEMSAGLEHNGHGTKEGVHESQSGAGEETHATDLSLNFFNINHDDESPAQGHYDNTQSPDDSVPSDPDDLGALDATFSPLETSHNGETTIHRPQPSLISHSSQSPSQPTSQSDLIQVAPSGIMESAKFPEDLIYYHHIRDGPPYGLLSVLSLDNMFQVKYLDASFFHAALALSAFDISHIEGNNVLAKKARLHALDHYVTALGTVSRTSNLLDLGFRPDRSYAAISWLATTLFLAHFELQRGEMRLWYIHSCAAVNRLSRDIRLVRGSVMGEPILRSFSRIAALLNIYDRTYSVQPKTCPDIPNSLQDSLLLSPCPTDRLLFTLPRVIELEEDWRSNPQEEDRFREQADKLISELEEWRCSLDEADVPFFNDIQSPEGGGAFSISPLTLSDSRQPIRAATNFMHYLISLLRLGTHYLPGSGRQQPSNSEHLVLLVCRLAAGVTPQQCAAINAYGHGMVPALMNAYYITHDGSVKAWIVDWLNKFPREREGIWNVRHATRLLAYIDEEYSRRGAGQNWGVIKVRMIDLEDENTPEPVDVEKTEDRFTVEIYSRSKRGWSIDFVDVP